MTRIVDAESFHQLKSDAVLYGRPGESAEELVERGLREHPEMFQRIEPECVKVPSGLAEMMVDLRLFDDDFRKSFQRATAAIKRFSEQLEALLLADAAEAIRTGWESGDHRWRRYAAIKLDASSIETLHFGRMVSVYRLSAEAIRIELNRLGALAIEKLNAVFWKDMHAHGGPSLEEAMQLSTDVLDARCAHLKAMVTLATPTGEPVASISKNESAPWPSLELRHEFGVRVSRTIPPHERPTPQDYAGHASNKSDP